MNHSEHVHSQHPVQNNLTDIVSSTPAAHVHDHSAHHHSHQQHATTHDAHIMKMWFHGGSYETILFEFWQIETYLALFASCIAIILMGVLYEGVKWFRIYIHNIQLAAKHRQSGNGPKVALSEIHSQADEGLLNTADSHAPETGTLRSDEVYKSTVTRENNRTKKCRVEKILHRMDLLNPSPFSLFHIIQTALYVLQITLAFWLMLIVMTYNSWLTIAVILGCGLGHWIFVVSNFVRFPNDTMTNAFSSDVCH